VGKGHFRFLYLRGASPSIALVLLRAIPTFRHSLRPFVYIFATPITEHVTNVGMFADLRRSTGLSHSAGMFTDLRRSNRSVYLPTSSGRETPVGVVLRNTGLPHNSTRTRRQEHGPARTSIICSSAPEPLLALGVGVPEPPSPGERFCTPGPPWRAPPPGCQKVVVGRQAPINPLRMVYTMIWPAAGAAHGVLHRASCSSTTRHLREQHTAGEQTATGYLQTARDRDLAAISCDLDWLQKSSHSTLSCTVVLPRPLLLCTPAAAPPHGTCATGTQRVSEPRINMSRSREIAIWARYQVC
jgi:hypothetical protein